METNATTPVSLPAYEFLCLEGKTLEEVVKFVLGRFPKARQLRRGNGSNLLFVSHGLYVGECWKIGLGCEPGFMLMIASKEAASG